MSRWFSDAGNLHHFAGENKMRGAAWRKNHGGNNWRVARDLTLPRFLYNLNLVPHHAHLRVEAFTPAVSIILPFVRLLYELPQMGFF